MTTRPSASPPASGRAVRDKVSWPTKLIALSCDLGGSRSWKASGLARTRENRPEPRPCPQKVGGEQFSQYAPNLFRGRDGLRRRCSVRSHQMMMARFFSTPGRALPPNSHLTPPPGGIRFRFSFPGPTGRSPAPVPRNCAALDPLCRHSYPPKSRNTVDKKRSTRAGNP